MSRLSRQARAIHGPLRPQASGLPVTLAVGGVLMINALVALSLAGAGSFVAAFHAGLVFSTLTLGAVFITEYRRTGNALSPMCLGSFALFLYFPFHGYMAHDEPFVVQLLGADRYEFFAYGLLVVGFAALALLAGYRSGVAARVHRRMPRTKRPLDDRNPKLRNRLILLYLAALVARALLYSDGLAFHYGSALQDSKQLIRVQFLLVTTSSLAPLVMLYTLATGIRTHNKIRIQVAIALLIIELVWGLLSGSRLKMVLPIGLTVLVVGDLWRPIRLRHLVIGTLLFTLLVFPLVSAFRAAYFGHISDIQRGGLSTEIITDSIQDAFASDEPEGFVSDTESPALMLARRAHGLTSLALIMRFTPERHDYLLGVPYLMIPANVLIPRAIWSDKPDVGEFIKVFRARYWGVDRGDHTSIAVTLIADFWVNLNLFGVLLGMFIYGVMLRYLRDFLHLGAGRSSALRYALYAMLLVPFLKSLEGTFDGFVAGTLKTMVLYYIAVWFLSRGARKPRAPRPLGATP